MSDFDNFPGSDQQSPQAAPPQPAPSQPPAQSGQSDFDSFPGGEPSGGPPAPSGPPVTEAPNEGDEGVMSSGPAAAIRAAARGAIPAIGTAIGGTIGAAIGAGVGAPSGVGAIATTVGGAALGGIAGAKVAQSTQDFLIHELGLDQLDSVWDPFSTAQTQRDVAEHPNMTTAGNVAAQAAGFAADPAAKAAQRIAMGVAGAAGDVVSQWQEKGFSNIDPLEAAEAGGMGAMFPKARFGARIAGRPNVQPTPEVLQDRALTDKANDITTTAPGVAAENTKAPEIPTGNTQGTGNKLRADGPTDGRKAAVQTEKPTYTQGEQQPEIWAALGKLSRGEEPAQPTPEPQPAPQVAPQQDVQAKLQGLVRQPGSPQPEPQSVTAPITPPRGVEPGDGQGSQRIAQPKVLTQGLQQLRDMGVVTRPDGTQVDARMVADAIERRNVPPGAKAANVSQALANLTSQTGQAMGTATPRLSSQRPMVGGVMARSQGDAAKKQGALDAIRQTYAELGPANVQLDPNNPQQIKTIANQARTRATELNGGNDPLDAYKKLKDIPPEMNWLKAARAYDRTGGQKFMREFLAAHALQGETGKNIEGEIARKPQQDTDNIAAQGAPIEMAPRETFPMLGPEMQNGKRVWTDFVEGHNELRNGLNSLSDEDYNRLQEIHGVPLATEVNTSHSPRDLMSELLQELAEAKQGAPVSRLSKFEYPAEEGTQVERPIKKAADLVQNPVRHIDPNSPEGQDIARRYGIAQAKTPQEIAKVADLHEADGDVVKRATDTMSVMDRLKALAKDQSGAGRPMIGGLVPMRGNPNVNANAKVTMDEINSRLTRMASAMDAEQSHMYDVMRPVPAVNLKDPNGWTPSDFRRIYRAMADRTTDQLAPREKELVDNIYEPMRQYDQRLADELWDLKQKNPNIKVNAQEYKEGVDKTSMPRLVEGLQSWERDPASSPFTTERHFPTSAMSEEDRSYYALKDSKGNRSVARENPTDDLQYRRATIFGVKDDAPINKGKFIVGDTIKINGKTYTVDHASPEEIMNAGVKWKSGANAGKPITYIEDPSLALSQSIMQKRSLIEATKFLRDTLNDPRFKENTTVDRDAAIANGWTDRAGRPYAFPEFIKSAGKTLYGDPRLAYPMEDYLREGFQDATPDRVRQFGSEMIQSLFAMQPIYHGLNVATNYAISRGLDWLPMSGGWRTLAQLGPKAIRLAITRGPEYEAYKKMGAPLNMGGTMSQNFLPNLAKRVGQGEGFLKDPSKLDPIAHIFGMSTPDFYQALKQQSNKVTWFLGDAFTLHRIMELEELHGLSKQAAIEEAKQIIPSYERMPTVMGSRAAAKALQDPAFSLFGKYLWGNIWSYANIVNRVATGSPAQRRQAVGQLMVAGILLGFAFPALDRALQGISGNDQARVRRFGMGSLPDAISRIGSEGLGPVMGQFARESVPVQMITSLLGNDSMNKPIYQPGTGPVEGTAQVGGWLANQIPAVQQAWSAYHAGEGEPKEVAKRLLGQQVGADIPSPRSTRYKAKRDYENMRGLKARRKNPQNAFEEVYQRLVNGQ